MHVCVVITNYVMCMLLQFLYGYNNILLILEVPNKFIEHREKNKVMELLVCLLCFLYCKTYVYECWWLLL